MERAKGITRWRSPRYGRTAGAETRRLDPPSHAAPHPDGGHLIGLPSDPNVTHATDGGGRCGHTLARKRGRPEFAGGGLPLTARGALKHSPGGAAPPFLG